MVGNRYQFLYSKINELRRPGMGATTDSRENQKGAVVC